MLSYPKYCEVCFETNPSKLERCPDCKCSSFCERRECQTIAAANPNIHKKYCKEKKITFWCNRDILSFEKVFDKLPEPLQLTEFFQTNPKDCDVFTLIEHLSGKTFIKTPENQEEMKSFATVCQFNYTATLMYALHKANLLQPDREMLSIDIVGVKAEEFYFNEETCGLFFAFMPKLRYLRIDLIGPELITKSSSKEMNFFGRTVKLVYFQKVYERCIIMPKADFIMCFNCGFDEFVPERSYKLFSVTPGIILETPWVHGLEKILNQKVPFAFTQCTRKDFDDDVDFLKAMANYMEVNDDLTGVFFGRNCFKDAKIIFQVKKSAEESVHYGNEFMCVMNWKENLEGEFDRLKTIFEKATEK